jgi:hypothetical protein
MSKRAELPQSRRHVLIFDEDWAWLDTQYGPYSKSRLGTGVAVRKIVHQRVQQLRQAEQDRIDSRQNEVAADD